MPTHAPAAGASSRFWTSSRDEARSRDPRRLRARVRRRLPCDGARLLRARHVDRRGARALPRRPRRRHRAATSPMPRARTACACIRTRSSSRSCTTCAVPAILHWRFSHFVVLEQMTRDGAVIVDPAMGRRDIDRDELGESFTGVALGLEPGVAFDDEGDIDEEPAWRLLARRAFSAPGARQLVAADPRRLAVAAGARPQRPAADEGRHRRRPAAAARRRHDDPRRRDPRDPR